MNSMRRLFVYPGCFNLVVIVALHNIIKLWGHPTLVAVAIATAIGVSRYLLANYSCGLYVSYSRNWYIKQIIYIAASLVVVALYSVDKFAWTVGIYFATLWLLEIAVSLRSRALARNSR